ncbi:hypothetical protein BDW74DRAFT_152897 [Aspergillus multicolor]|uniref:uncharacterized protein n=1 Tax=Aspergillus multicolor TaxID=41759 RepID=UPI003CCCD87F
MGAATPLLPASQRQRPQPQMPPRPGHRALLPRLLALLELPESSQLPPSTAPRPLPPENRRRQTTHPPTLDRYPRPQHRRRAVPVPGPQEQLRPGHDRPGLLALRRGA